MKLAGEEDTVDKEHFVIAVKNSSAGADWNDGNTTNLIKLVLILILIQTLIDIKLHCHNNHNQ